MSEEFNKLDSSFNNSPNNLETSDETQAAYNYADVQGTIYSRSKLVSRIIKVVGVSLVGGGVVLGITNSFIQSPPTVTDLAIKVDETVDSLHYEFKITNDRKYKVSFIVTSIFIGETEIDCSESTTYKGTVENLGYDQDVQYKITFSNRADYKKILTSGTLHTVVIGG